MSKVYEGLQVVDLLGVFYEQDGRLFVADEFEGTKDVLDSLSSLAGKKVHLLAHHRPSEPVDKNRWGGGCCVQENTGFCSFGHHEYPQSLYTYNSVGVLEFSSDALGVRPQGGELVECCSRFLIGHRSQILVTTLPNLEELSDKVKSFDPSNLEGFKIEELTERLSELRDFLSQMNDMKDNL